MPTTIHFVEEDAPAIDVAEDAAPVIHFVEEKLPMSDEDAWSMIRKYSNPQPGLESPTPAPEPSEPGFAKLPRFSSTTTGPAPAQFGENSILGDPAEVFTQAKGIADAISYLTPLPAAARLGIKGLQQAASMIPTGSQEAWESGVGAARDVARRIPTGLLTGSGITAPFLHGFGDRGSSAPPDTETTERTAAFGRAIAEQAKGLTEFTVSDLGLATLAAGGPIAGAAAKILPWAGRAIKTLISAGFTADIASKLPDQYEKYIIAQEQGTPAEKVVATVELGAPLLMLGMTTLHAATGAGKLADPVVNAVKDKIGGELILGRAVRGQDAPVIPELGDQFVPGIAGTRGSAFEPENNLAVMEQARRLGLSRTIEAAVYGRGYGTPPTRESISAKLASDADLLATFNTPPEIKQQLTEGGEIPNVQKEKEGVQVAPTAEPPVITPPEVPVDPVVPETKGGEIPNATQPQAPNIELGKESGQISTTDALNALKERFPEDAIRSAFRTYQRNRFGQEVDESKIGVTGTQFALFAKEFSKGNPEAVNAFDQTKQQKGETDATQTETPVVLPEQAPVAQKPNESLLNQLREEVNAMKLRVTTAQVAFDEAQRKLRTLSARYFDPKTGKRLDVPEDPEWDKLIREATEVWNKKDSELTDAKESLEKAQLSAGITYHPVSIEEVKILAREYNTSAYGSPYRILTSLGISAEHALWFERNLDGTLDHFALLLALEKTRNPILPKTREETWTGGKISVPRLKVQVDLDDGNYWVSIEPETKPNANQTETPVGGVSPTSTGTPPLVGEGTPSSGGQPGGARTETTQTETPALTPESPAVPPAAPPVIPPEAPPITPPKPPPIIPPLGDYDRPAGSPIGIKNAEIDRLRAEMGMEPIAKAAGLPDKVLWQRVMDRIEREPNWIDTVISDIKKTGRGHTNDEALGLTHRLVETRTEFYKESRKAAKARDAGDMMAEAQAKVNTDFWSDKLVELEQIVMFSGSELASAFRARQFMMDEDFSPTALELKKRKAKDWAPLSEAERTEIEKIHADYVAKTEKLQAHNAEQRGKLVDAEIKLAAAEAARGPDYDPQLLKIVERVASFMDKAATSAMDRITQRRKGGQLRMDPSLGTLDLAADLVDASIIGAAKIARKINDFTIWSDAMRKQVGEWIIPHLKEVWEASKAQVPKSVDDSLKAEKPATKAKAKAALTGQDVAEKIEAAKDKIAAKVEKGQSDEIFDLASIYYPVQALVRAIVERDPTIARGPLINEVHGVLKEFLPDIKKMDTMDAITGVGKFETPKQDIVSKTVRELKTQTRLASHFIRTLMKERLPRTGYQHGKLSQVSRNLNARLNEAKRRFPLEPTDPESQLGSVLQARKTYYTHRMADLKLEIKARQRKIKTTTPSPTDPELNALIEEYAAVKRDHDAMFGDPKMTREQRLKLLESSAARHIVELQRQLDMDEVFAKSKRPSTLSSAKLEAQRARIEALQAEREWARMLNEPDLADPFEVAMMHARARMTRQIADYTKRVADGDYAPRTRKPPADITQDKRAMSLMADLQKIKRDFDKGLALDEAKKRSGVQKLLAGTGEVLNIPRALWSSFDLSAVGRQGAIMLMGHPIRSAKSVVPMIKALFSEKAALIEEQKIINRPNYQNGNYAKSELYLASLDEFRLNRQEELQMSHYSNLIPGVRPSNRAFMTYLNKLRADSFDVMLQSRERWFSKPVEQFEKDAISNYINISTGRGYLGNHAAAAQTLATIFWAPRLMASRIQYLSGQPLLRYSLKKGGWRTSAMIGKEYAQTLMGMGAVIGLAKLAGADIETDPNSSDFLKLKFGNARVDIMGGLFQNVVFVNRLLISGKIKTASGKEKPVKAGPLIWDFARNKFTPLIGTGLDVRDLAFGQKPPAGHPQSLGDLVLNLPVPLSFRDVFTLLREEGVPATSALTLVSIFGWGVQYYDALAGEKPSAKPTYPDSMFKPAPTRRAAQP